MDFASPFMTATSPFKHSTHLTSIHQHSPALTSTLLYSAATQATTSTQHLSLAFHAFLAALLSSSSTALAVRPSQSCSRHQQHSPALTSTHQSSPYLDQTSPFTLKNPKRAAARRASAASGRPRSCTALTSTQHTSSSTQAVWAGMQAQLSGQSQCNSPNSTLTLQLH